MMTEVLTYEHFDRRVHGMLLIFVGVWLFKSKPAYESVVVESTVSPLPYTLKRLTEVDCRSSNAYLLELEDELES